MSLERNLADVESPVEIKTQMPLFEDVALSEAELQEFVVETTRELTMQVVDRPLRVFLNSTRTLIDKRDAADVDQMLDTIGENTTDFLKNVSGITERVNHYIAKRITGPMRDLRETVMNKIKDEARGAVTPQQVQSIYDAFWAWRRDNFEKSEALADKCAKLIIDQMNEHLDTLVQNARMSIDAQTG